MSFSLPGMQYLSKHRFSACYLTQKLISVPNNFRFTLCSRQICVEVKVEVNDVNELSWQDVT